MPEWKLWTPSVLPPRWISLLQRLDAGSNEDNRAFAHVRDYIPRANPVKTNVVVVFTGSISGDFSARITTSYSREFTDCLNSGEWKSQILDLTDPALIENIVTSLQAVSAGNKHVYELYEAEAEAHVIVARKPDDNYKPEPPGKPQMVEVGLCPAGGKHQLSGPVIVQSSGGIAPPPRLQTCRKCRGWVNPS